MNASLAALDLPAAALAEYERRRKAWHRLVDTAASNDERARIRTQANGDLLVWQDILQYVTGDWTPDDSRPMARSARSTFDKISESGKASNDQIHGLYALWHTLDRHACLRHGWDWAEPVAERRAA